MACDKCGDSGWSVSTDDNGYSSAKPCSCRPAPVKPPRPSAAAYVRVAGVILSNAPFAPKNDADMRTVLEAWLAASIDSDDELQRFMVYVLERMTEWGGIAGLGEMLQEMRQARAAKSNADEQDRRLLQWREEAKMLSASPDEPEPIIHAIKLKGYRRMPRRSEAEEHRPDLVREVGYINGEGFTLQRAEPKTLHELEAQLAKDLEDAPVKSPEEQAEKARLLEAEVMVRARFREDNQK